MDSSISSNDEERMETIHCAEIAYKEALRNNDLMIKDEGARRLRLSILLLENENDDLHDQLALADDRIDELEQEGDEVRAELENSREDLQRQETELRSQARELNILKTELKSMNGVTMDSTKILTEKLALARELATLKPELDHLRSQAIYQQTVLADKLALQRQVSTLEVELETEKRASKRASEKNKNKDNDLELQQQLEDLQKELAREKRDREKARKEAEKELAAERASKRGAEKGISDKAGHFDLQQELEATQKLLDSEKREREKIQKELDASETQITLLGGKLDHMRTKMRATKEQLKECQAELEEVRVVAAKGQTALIRGDMTAKSARKRAAAEMSTDVTIGTPDGGAIRGKKRGRMDQTMPGAKSTFSITPYLNRTVNLNLESPALETSEDVTVSTATDGFQQSESHMLDAVFDENSPSALPKSHAKRRLFPKTPTAKKTLGEASIGTSNRKRDPKLSRSISSLEFVPEEGGDENKEPASAPTATNADTEEEVLTEREVYKTSKVPVKGGEETEPKNEPKTEPKKKKRKFLSGRKTLFDEIDDEAMKRSAKKTPGQTRSLGQTGVAGTKSVPRGLGSSSAFGTFSPLKKDRKISGASFLA